VIDAQQLCTTQDTWGRTHVVGPIHMGLMENDGFTTPPQQLHNTPSHGVRPSVWGPPLCEGVLCNCCTGEV
jgi:hypothetical protein